MIAEGKGAQLLIGTTKNCILTGSLDLGFSPVIIGGFFVTICSSNQN